MMTLVSKSYTPMNSAPRLRIVPRAPVIEAVPTAEAIVREAEMELAQGYRVLDDSLADRLESVARDSSLPTATRARAMSALCRFG